MRRQALGVGNASRHTGRGIWDTGHGIPGWRGGEKPTVRKSLTEATCWARKEGSLGIADSKKRESAPAAWPWGRKTGMRRSALGGGKGSRRREWESAYGVGDTRYGTWDIGEEKKPTVRKSLTALWRSGLAEYEEMEGIAWNWQSVDGAIVKSPLPSSAWARTRRIGEKKDASEVS